MTEKERARGNERERGEGGRFLPSKKTEAVQKQDSKQKLKIPRTAEGRRKQIREVLTTLLDETQSGATRISAAKVLLEQLDKKENEDHEASRREEEERAAAIAEARTLLARLAAAKSGSVPKPPPVA